MSSRPRHTKKDIEEVLRYAESNGWRIEKRSGHTWARIFCAHADRNGCQISVFSTPKNPFNHAKSIRRLIDKCICEAQKK